MKPKIISRLIYDKAVDITTSRRRSPRAYRDSALDEYKKKNIDYAIHYYEQAINLNPEDETLYGELAQIYYEQNDYSKAEKYYLKALKYSDNYPRAIKGLGLTYHQMGIPDEAIYWYLRFLRVNENDVDTLINLGTSLYALGEYKEAIGYFQRAEKIDPKNVSIYENLAAVYYDLGDYGNTIKTLTRAQELGLKSAQISVLHGLAWEAMGDEKKARKSYERAIKKDETNGDAYLNLGRLLSNMGEFNEALKNAEHALELYSKQENSDDRSLAMWDIGWYYYKLGDLKNSIKVSKKALEIIPELSPVRFNLALAQLLQGNPKEARKNYKRGIEDLTDLNEMKIHAIDDLEDALKENKDITDGKKILGFLKEQYTSLKRYESIGEAILTDEPTTFVDSASSEELQEKLDYILNTVQDHYDKGRIDRGLLIQILNILDRIEQENVDERQIRMLEWIEEFCSGKLTRDALIVALGATRKT
jgi:tetratricopeptide (TPR) repeat protein